MDVLTVCFNAILPLFFIMITGYLARCLKLIREEDIGRINSLAYHFLIPIMLFYSTYTSPAKTAMNLNLLAFSLCSTLLTILISIVFTLSVVKEKEKQGVIIHGLYRSNFAIVGMAIATSLVGADNVAPAAALLVTAVPLNNISAVIIFETFNGKKVDVRQIIIGIVKNPLLIGVVLGMIFSFMEIRLPEVINNTLSKVSQASTPLSLLMLGAFFHFDNVRKYKKDLTMVCLGRLVVFPGIFLAIGYFMGFRGAEFAALIALFSTSTVTVSFTMAQQLGGDSRLAGNIVVLTNLLFPFTVFLWSALYMYLGAF